MKPRKENVMPSGFRNTTPLRLRWLVLALASGLACGGDTGRGRTHFDLDVVATPGPVFTTEAGYEVTLTEARLSLARIEFFEGDPLFSLRRVWSRLVPSALAHPGHYREGEALADVLTPVVANLLAEAPALLEGDGVTGDYRSARIELGPDDALDGATVIVAGEATRGDERFPFRGRLALEESIDGVAVGYTVDAPTGHFAMEIDLSAWLDRVEFDEVGPDVDLRPDTQPYNAWLRGVRNTSAYGFAPIEGE
jgi:hypothetical protein